MSILGAFFKGTAGSPIIRTRETDAAQRFHYFVGGLRAVPDISDGVTIDVIPRVQGGVEYAVAVDRQNYAPTLTLPIVNTAAPDVSALRAGLRIEQRSFRGYFHNRTRINGTTLPAKVSGEYGFGVAEDEADAQAWVIDPDTGLKTELNRVANAGDPTTGQFTVGANGATKINADINNQILERYYPLEASASNKTALSETRSGDLYMKIPVLTTNDEIVVVEFEKLALAGGQNRMSANRDDNLTYQILSDDGDCDGGIKMYWLGPLQKALDFC